MAGLTGQRTTPAAKPPSKAPGGMPFPFGSGAPSGALPNPDLYARQGSHGSGGMTALPTGMSGTPTSGGGGSAGGSGYAAPGYVSGGGPGSGGTVQGGGSSVPALPVLQNTTQQDPNLTKIWEDYRQAVAQKDTPKVEELWGMYQDQLSSSNLDRLQDVVGSKIRDRYAGASSALDANLARRGILGSGVEGELRSEMAMSEAGDLSRSDAELALADQSRRDNLILQGMPMATYDRNRLDSLIAQGIPLATAMHQLANEDKALGLRQWEDMLGAQLSREQFGLTRDIAAQNAHAAQNAQMISLLSAMAPLF